MAVSPISWQRNLNLCGSPRSSSESRRPLDVISVCTRPGQHVTDRVGPYQPHVPGAEFELGVRWRLALTSIGVPGQSLGKPPVVVFSLGLGGVPGEGPVAGQLGLTHLTLCVPVLSSRGLSPSRSLAPQLGPQGPVVGRKSQGRWSPTRARWSPTRASNIRP